MIHNRKDLFYKIKEQRKNIVAAVDTCGLPAISKKFPEESYRFLILVSLILSSQTKDEFTHESVQNFIEKDIISCKNLALYTVEEIKKLISKVGFANKKANYLLTMANQYMNKNLPTEYKEVVSIKGVGSKMAILYLYYGCNKIEGISVDTHVHRISQRLGYSNNKNVEKCRLDLQNIFEKEEWPDINYILVGFGQTICKAINPLCKECCIKTECPSSKYTINW